MTDISTHPLLKQAYGLCIAIEACGVGQEITHAVTLACDLMRGIDNALVDKDEDNFQQLLWRDNEIEYWKAQYWARNGEEVLLRRTSEYWKAEHLAGNAEIERLRVERDELKDAIVNCLDWSAGREDEWGDRAVNAHAFLHKAIDKTGRPVTGGITLNANGPTA